MNGSRTHTLDIRTPEGIRFSLLPASPVIRFLAWTIDAAIVYLVLLAAIQTAAYYLASISFDVGMSVLYVSALVAPILYSTLLEWRWKGQTVGKKVFRLRVVDERGLRLQLSQIIMRNLLRAVDSLPLFYLVGGISTIFTRHAQRLGDLAANTVVVRTPRLREPDLEQLALGQFNSFREHPHLEARLRQLVPHEEASLAVRALLRRGQLDDDARLRLFAELAQRFRERVPFPPETAGGLSDEQYVRNVVDTLYRSKSDSRRSIPTSG